MNDSLKARVLGLVGSPRTDSNTEYFVRLVLDYLKEKGCETELVLLRKRKINPCRACYQCWERGECTQEGDDFKEVFSKMVDADVIIAGSPVHFGYVHPTLWSLLVRAGFSTFRRGTFSRKIGGPVTVARRAGHNTAFTQLLSWFFINDFIVPGSIYWNVMMAGAGGARDAQKDEEGIMIAKHFAENVYWLLEKIKG